MRAIYRPFAIGAILAIGTLAGCNSSQTTVGESTSTKAPNSFELHTKADTKQLMRWILEPHADMVWAVGGTTVTDAGEQKSAPKTDKEWNDARDAAATVAEAGNLLLVKPHTRGSDEWVTLTHKMIDEANKCVEAAEAKDIDTFFIAGGDLYEACTACHAKYVMGDAAKQATK